MLPDISSSLYVIFGAAFFALLTQIRWPKIRLQTERQSGVGVRVTDVMLSVAEPAPHGARIVPAEPKFECSVYIVWKTRKR
ncbi:MAG: hypothetical protein KGK16_09220 [Bradyrhizobium sp.]|uniref:hypothetical protein n=1 Tax=Bradyrhizobium sp. TaxID=376 RepID=UPI001EB0D8C5|nr:hypothetical protein [Bradyrhizobium sp.]MBU6457786.1 hypothetical protein [Bradyrhizobium sp.]MDE2330947.1 hypothetical protein [Bradyrhizobium sp.]MDE2602432.1 hypothetical protein [Bradyrhizobium sp.]